MDIVESSVLIVPEIVLHRDDINTTLWCSWGKKRRCYVVKTIPFGKTRSPLAPYSQSFG